MISDRGGKNKDGKKTVSVGTIKLSDAKHVVTDVPPENYPDWEDIEYEKCYFSGGNCIYVSNLGDNGLSE